METKRQGNYEHITLGADKIGSDDEDDELGINHSIQDMLESSRAETFLKLTKLKQKKLYEDMLAKIHVQRENARSTDESGNHESSAIQTSTTEGLKSLLSRKRASLKTLRNSINIKLEELEELQKAIQNEQAEGRNALKNVLDDLYKEVRDKKQHFIREDNEYSTMMNKSISKYKDVHYASKLHKIREFWVTLCAKITNSTTDHVKVLNILRCIESMKRQKKAKILFPRKKENVNPDPHNHENGDSTRIVSLLTTIQEEIERIRNLEESLGVIAYAHTNDYETPKIADVSTHSFSRDVAKNVMCMLNASLDVPESIAEESLPRRGQKGHQTIAHNNIEKSSSTEAIKETAPIYLKSPMQYFYPSWNKFSQTEEQRDVFPIRTATAQLEGLLKLMAPSRSLHDVHCVQYDTSKKSNFNLIQGNIERVVGRIKLSHKRIQSSNTRALSIKMEIEKLRVERDTLRARFLKMYPRFWSNLTDDERFYFNDLLAYR